MGIVDDNFNFTYLDVEQMARFFDVSEDSIRRLCLNQIIPAVKGKDIGIDGSAKRWFCKVDELKIYIKEYLTKDQYNEFNEFLENQKFLLQLGLENQNKE